MASSMQQGNVERTPVPGLTEGFLSRLASLGRVRLNEPMRLYTSFRTGGHADVLARPHDRASLQEMVRLAGAEGVPVTVIGGASNLLVGDGGIRGLVVRISDGDGSSGRLSLTGEGTVYTDASVRKEDFINFCLECRLEGMEFMAGIPGCLGGGIVMNAGTTEGNFADILDTIEFVDTEGTLKSLKVRPGMAGYRRMDIGTGAIVVGASCLLRRSDDAGRVKRAVEETIRERWIKHPMDFPSAGSVFKNPEGHSSWKLVDDAGLKGCRIGGAMVSERHTNFIINFDNATSLDILNLIGHVREKVYKAFNIMLEPEIRMLGEM